MKIKYKKLILTFIVSIFFISCSSTKLIKDTTSNFEVSKNTDIIIELKANPTTGYIWKMLIEQDNNVLDFVKDTYIIQNKKLVGSPSIYQYKIKAISKGKAVIKGYYHRPWEQTNLSLVEPNAVYEITVN